MRKIVFIALLATVFVSPFVGYRFINPLKLNPYDARILLDLRIPRVLLALAEGALLGASGALFQTVLRNPLADGFTVGVASSSALGAALAISLGLGSGTVTLTAFLFGLAGLWLVYRLSERNGVVEPLLMILAGIAINILASSLISLTKFLFEESVLSVVFWLMGGIRPLKWSSLLVILAVSAMLILLSIKNAYRLNLLALDEASAISLGLDTSKTRKRIFILATLMVAVSVSVSGIIAFVGLIVPHMARWLSGADARKTLILSSLGGAWLLAVSDTLSRSLLIQGSEVPVGVITSSLGGGFFLFLLFRAKRGVWYG